MSDSSSPTISTCRPDSRSAARRSSVAWARSSSRRAISPARPSPTRSANAGPRQSCKASPRRSRTRSGWPSAALASRTSSLEPGGVELVGLDVEDVPGCPSLDPLRPQRLAEVGDVGLDRVARALRRLVPPQMVDQRSRPARPGSGERAGARARRAVWGRRARSGRPPRRPRADRGPGTASRDRTPRAACWEGSIASNGSSCVKAERRRLKLA